MVAIARLFAGVFLALVPFPLVAGEVTVAVAANFLTTAETVVAQFEDQTGHTVRLAHGATGALTAQIERGAPFDVFLAADAVRPERLHAAGLAGAPRTYALGQVVLAFRDLAVPREEITRIAMANPRLAPYGLAAEEVLTAWGLTARRLTGENVAQALSFVVTGNAQAGLVGLAQVAHPNFTGSFERIPPDLYTEIRQDAVLLDRAGDNPAAVAFYEFLFSAEAQDLIFAAGYALEGRPQP